MKPHIGVFVAYWPCGKCISAGALDFGEPGDGELIEDAIRQGRRVGYLPGSNARADLKPCDCSPRRDGAERE